VTEGKHMPAWFLRRLTKGGPTEIQEVWYAE
jgi:hypothetical protein